MQASSSLRAYARWSIAATTFRLPIALLPVAIEYAIGTTDGFRLASAIIGMLSLGEIGVLLLTGHRAGRRLLLRRGHLLFWAIAVADALLAAASLVPGMLALAIVAALAIGLLVALGAGSLRRELTAVLPREAIERYFSWDAVVLEVIWLASPAIVALQVSLSLTPYLLILPALCALATPLAMRRPPVIYRAEAKPIHGGKWLLAASAAEGVIEAGFVVAIVPIASGVLHLAVFGSIALALLSVGSVVGGAIYAPLSRHLRIPPRPRILIMLSGLAAALAVLATAGTTTIALAVISLALGILVAPTNAARAYATSTTFQQEDHSSAFARLYASYSVGAVFSSAAFATLSPLLGARATTGLDAGVAALVILVIAVLPRIRQDRPGGKLWGSLARSWI